jgi:hypothetical protein
MGVFYETIPDSLKPWILEQQMLFVYISLATLSPTSKQLTPQQRNCPPLP